MKRATTVVLALGALVGGGVQPALAQVVIGGSDEPNVHVNWSVLDRLGPSPNLPDMLKAGVPEARQSLAPAGKAAPQGIQYRPYQPEKTIKAVAAERKAAKPAAAKAVAKAAPVKVDPAVTDLADAAKALKAVSVAAKPVVVAPPTMEVPKAVAVEPVPLKPVAVEPTKAVAVEPLKPVAVEPPKAAAPAIVKIDPPAPAPIPAPVAAAVEAVPLPQTAVAAAIAPAVPSPAAIVQGDTMSVLFAGDNAKLPDGAHGDLDRLARRMEKDEGLGLQLLAYAGGDESSASKARRLSLSRALEVRKYLMEQGVRSTRIEVRALGNKIDKGAADRVDAVVVGR